MRTCLECLECLKIGKIYVCIIDQVEITNECEAWKKGLGRGTDCDYWNMIDADGQHLWKDDVNRDSWEYENLHVDSSEE